MRKSLIAIVLIGGIVFATGYLIGQIRGITASSAAGPSTNDPAPAIPWGGMRPFLGTHGPGHMGPHAGGKVTAVTGNTITVQPFVDRDGQEAQVTTIQVTGSTKYFTGFNQAATKAAVKVGSYVKADGTVSSDGKTLNATSVFVFSSAMPHGTHWGHASGGPHADGKVTAVNGDTISVQADTDPTGSTEYSHVTTVQLTSSTTYDAGPGQAGSKSDVKVGSYIIALGSLSSDGKTLTATHVVVLPAGASGFHGRIFPGFRSNVRFNPFGGNSSSSV
jgi:hypothetical protein